MIRAVAQKVDSQANFRFHQGRQNAVCTVFPDRLVASDALAGPDVVLRRSAARFQESFQAPVRDCPWVTGEKARSDAHPPRQALQPLGGRKKVESQPEHQAAVQKASMDAAHPANSLDDQLVTADELVRLPKVALQAALRGQPILQPVVLRRAMRQEQ